MKTYLAFLLVLLFVPFILADVNETAKQGELIAVRIPAQLIYGDSGAGLEVQWADGVKTYKINPENGVVYVGVDVDCPPGVYKVFLLKTGEYPSPFGEITVQKGKFKKRGLRTEIFISADREKEIAEIREKVSACSPSFFLGPIKQPLQMPLDKIIITGEFGSVRPHILAYDNGKRVKSDDSHKGVDLRTCTFVKVGWRVYRRNCNQPVYAMNEGIVFIAKKFSKEGNVVGVCHESQNNICTVYSHLLEMKVKEGDFVKSGQAIAISGNTGVLGNYETPHHLDVKMLVQGAFVDPLKAVKTINKTLTRLNFTK